MNTSVQKYRPMNGAVSLSGLWDWIKRGAQAVGAAIGGPVGAVVAGFASDVIEGMVGGQGFGEAMGSAWQSQVQSVQDFLSPNHGNTQARGKSSKSTEDYKQDVIDGVKDWHDAQFIPWAKIYLQKLSPEQNSDFNSPAFREKVNEVIKNLEALRLYYKMKAETRAQQGRGLQLDIVLDEADFKSKASLFLAYKEVIQTAYSDYMTSNGKSANTETVSFEAHNFNADGPESVYWNGVEATSQIVLFREPKSIELTTDFPGGTRDPKEPTTKQPISTTREPNRLVATGNYNTTNKTQNAGLIPGVSNKTLYWVGGGIAGSWLLYKLSKTKN